MRGAATALFAALVLASPAAASTGGAEVRLDGGARVGDPGAPKPKPAKKRSARPRLGLFAAGRSLPGSVRFRLDGRRSVRGVRVQVLPAAGSRPVATVDLGTRRGRSVQRVRLGGLGLAEGSYRLRIVAPRLRRAKGVPATLPVAVLSHVFPVQGPHSFGGADARFGAGRPGHRHQGQDIVAAAGTPVVTPRGGIVKAVGYQRGGAGHYVVVDGAGEQRDYVFMHLQTGSIPIRQGAAIATGGRVGRLGSTGRSSGPHLHFEIWGGKGWFSGGEPIDPLPLLQSWK